MVDPIVKNTTGDPNSAEDDALIHQVVLLAIVIFGVEEMFFFVRTVAPKSDLQCFITLSLFFYIPVIIFLRYPYSSCHHHQSHLSSASRSKYVLFETAVQSHGNLQP